VNGWLLLGAAVLLSLERICYIWVWHAPDAFRAVCVRPPWSRLGGCVENLRILFIGFKLLQAGVFVGWCFVCGGGSLVPWTGPPWAMALGVVALALGQWLSASVFRRLGHVGVFYGNRFGYRTPWCQTFPFTWFHHPQYVGAVLSVWGFFMVMRFPHPDWCVLPTLETVYYALGARFER
jgi:phosphatidyl-N-methylethanolamine N-methyltransferase